VSERSLRARQKHREAAKRERIAQDAANRAAGLTPYLDGACPECGEGEAHVAFTTGIGRVVCMPMRRRAWWRRFPRW
jgi:hypothetical protein